MVAEDKGSIAEVKAARLIQHVVFFAEGFVSQNPMKEIPPNTCDSSSRGSERAGSVHAAEEVVDASALGIASAAPTLDVTPKNASSVGSHLGFVSDHEG